jgi:two-component system sensor histidine kinase BarA
MTSSTDIEHPACITHLLPEAMMASLARSFVRLTDIGFGFMDKDGVKVVIVSPLEEECGAVTGDDAELVGYCRKTREKLAVLHDSVLASKKLPHHEPTHHECLYGLAYSTRAILMEGDTIGYCTLGPYLPQAFHPPATEVQKRMGEAAAARLQEIHDSLTPLSRVDASAVLASSCGIVELLADYAYKISVAGQMQSISMEENYRMLLEKNRELQETKIRLEELDRLKSNILSTISHELRTPLTSIIGYSDMLLGQSGESLSGDQKKFIQTINEKGGSLLNMINKILDVASIEAGRFDMSRERYPVDQLVESAIDRVRRETPRLDVKIEYAPPEKSICTFGDPGTIEKAIYHVIDNAVKFSPPGGVVQVQMRRINPEMDSKDHKGFVIMAPTMKSVEIMVRDFGPGVPDELKDKIFEPFFQADDTTTRSHGGLGLGLALVKQYVWANKGQILVESHDGMGATFFIRLPVQDP